MDRQIKEAKMDNQEIIKLKKANEQLEKLLLRAIDRVSNPPVIMMEPKDVVARCHKAEAQLSKFKKLFLNIYIKMD